MSIYGKYSGGKDNAFNNSMPFKNIQFGLVVKTGKVQPNTDGAGKRRKDDRFNADRHAIRVRLIGSKYDNDTADSELANCFPILPKHLNFVPEEGEMVLTFLFGEDEKQSDRFYMGPFVSSEDKLDKDTMDSTASANLSTGTVGPGEDIDKNPLAAGIYEEPKHVVIEGRKNTDIIQRNGEVLIRAGKFKLNKKKEFNAKNPGYIQLKFNQTFNEEILDDSNIGTGEKKQEKPIEVTVANVVANKINLLTHNEKDDYGLTSRVQGAKGAAQYISDEEMDKILNEAHPMVFGDKLLDYLRLFKAAFLNHVHNPAGEQPTDSGQELPLEKFINQADELEKAMLSKNIRIN
jgi:hypothetical protein